MNALKAIHAICRKNGVDEDARRAIYKHVTGKSSATDMNERERKSVVAHMNKKFGNDYKNQRKSNKPYVRLIHALWRSCGEKKLLDNPTRPGLRAFVKNQSGVSDPEFLTYDQASPIIEALKAMEARG